MRGRKLGWLWLLAFVVLASGAAAAGIMLGEDDEAVSDATALHDRQPSGRGDAPAVSAVFGPELVLREPMVEMPVSQQPCRADDIELNVGADKGPDFLMFFNRSGRACGLLDYPVVQGLDDDGRWRTIPLVHSLGSSYSDGPPWTGSFDPRLTAVLSIRQPLDPDDQDCVRSGIGRGRFSAIRLLLHGDPDPVELPDLPLHVEDCRPAILLWAYDSTDM